MARRERTFVTEIPEHLLKRSRERRQALGLSTEGGEAATDAPAASAGAPATTTPAAAPAPAARATPPVPAAPPPPKPVPPYVQAAQRRRRIPIWAMPVLALLPLWALIYAQAMRPQEVELTGALAVGAEVFAQCSSCHGEAGQGGVGYPFVNGEVIKTFPDIEQQVAFVSSGSQVFDGQVYGDPNREGGPHIGLARGNGAMPAFGTQLTAAELLGVVCHERYTLGGGDQTGDEFIEYCAPDAPKFTEAEEAGG
jgi:mono/diheme cytochrome c family protein